MTEASRSVHRWGTWMPEYLPAAHRLTEQGWASRRIQNDDVILELTDEGLTVIELSGWAEWQSPN